MRRHRPHPPTAVLLARHLARARDLDDLHERLKLVELAAVYGRIDDLERQELLALHRVTWHRLVDRDAAAIGGAA